MKSPCKRWIIMLTAMAPAIFLAAHAKSQNISPVQLTLDWKAEPEFGGFYAGQLIGSFAKHGLAVDIKPAGEGADTWQLVATGKTDFATTAADQVLIARHSGADVIAIFTVYQTFPQGIMVHKSRGFTGIRDVFMNDGVLLAEDNSWLHYLEAKFGQPKVKIAGYDGGIADFLAKPDYSQQCFVTSEPILAKHQGSDPQTFLIADEGFNPYTTVVICKGDMWRNDPDKVKSMAAACREGWRAYLDDPAPANAAMHDLNSDMDPQTFTEAAAAQKPLIETEQTKTAGLGAMNARRWDDLAKQLTDLGVIDSSVKGEDCFVNP
ncbi:MAG: ABC transporter substrate-binding protein [Tepidisphaeraceae bacterium]|jgi:NitT/TauT family transport system substrate-binding protein